MRHRHYIIFWQELWELELSTHIVRRVSVGSRILFFFGGWDGTVSRLGWFWFGYGASCWVGIFLFHLTISFIEVYLM